MTRSSLFWNELTEAERAALRQVGRIVRYEPNSRLLNQGDQSDFTIVITGGMALVVAVSEDGHATTLGVRATGDLVGEQAGIDGGRRTAAVIAVKTTTGLLIPWPAFTKVMGEHPGVNRALLKTVSLRLRESDESRIRFTGDTVMARVAAQILILAGRHGRLTVAGQQITGISQENLASLVGASRETVSRALVVLREKKVVCTGRLQITVLDPESLRCAAAERQSNAAG